MQGKRVFEGLIASHLSNYFGLMGVRGTNYFCSEEELGGEVTDVPVHKLDSYTKYTDISLCSQADWRTHVEPPSGSEIDTLFSFWMFPSSWARTMFKEDPPTFRTAEDMFM